MKIWDDVGDPLYFSMSLSNYLCPVSFRRYSPLSLEIVENRTNVKVVLAPKFVGGTTPTFLRQIVSVIYCPPFGKAWLSLLRNMAMK